MNTEFWINKWQNGETRFHQSQPHPLLVKFSDKLTKGKILVPLCGKSLDMLYLASLGYPVIGVELSPIACEDFFKEASIDYDKFSEDGFIVYKSSEITLWCGDFFNLPQKVWDQITGVYDRAALIALPEDIRYLYAHEISKHTHQVEILLITLEYNKDFMQGPPYCVENDEITKIFESFDIVKLCSVIDEKFKTIEATENIYFMKKF